MNTIVFKTVSLQVWLARPKEGSEALRAGGIKIKRVQGRTRGNWSGMIKMVCFGAEPAMLLWVIGTLIPFLLKKKTTPHPFLQAN